MSVNMKFVGGPFDGKFMPVERKMDTIIMRVVKRGMSQNLNFLSAVPPGACLITVEIENHRYHLIRGYIEDYYCHSSLLRDGERPCIIEISNPIQPQPIIKKSVPPKPRRLPDVTSIMRDSADNCPNSAMFNIQLKAERHKWKTKI